MLQAEVAEAQRRLGGRLGAITIDGTAVVVSPPDPTDVSVHLRLEGASYDAEPFQLGVVGRDGRTPCAWPPRLLHSIHPVLRRPFACVQGTFEYHVHPGHVGDRWDAYRFTIRLADLLDHLLRKLGW